MVEIVAEYQQSTTQRSNYVSQPKRKKRRSYTLRTASEWEIDFIRVEIFGESRHWTPDKDSNAAHSQ